MNNFIPTTYSTRDAAPVPPRYNRVTRFVRMVVSRCVPRYRLRGTDNLPQSACVLVGNHARAMGPVLMSVRHPRTFRPWVAWQACFHEETARYAMADFWPGHKPRNRWFFKMLSRIIARPLAFLMCGMQAVPVYRDERVIITFRKSLQTLREGHDLLIFPETDRPFSEILNDLDDGFADLGRLAGKKEPLDFVPVYISPATRTIIYGAARRWDSTLQPREAREALANTLRDSIDALARKIGDDKPVTYRK